MVREAYEPPSVEDMPLRADEQLLAGCKTVGGAGLGTLAGLPSLRPRARARPRADPPRRWCRHRARRRLAAPSTPCARRRAGRDSRCGWRRTCSRRRCAGRHASPRQRQLVAPSSTTTASRSASRIRRRRRWRSCASSCRATGSTGTPTIGPTRRRGRFAYPADQLLMIHALGVAGGALTHAASIVGRDGALLVAGPSGAGKTTMSRAVAASSARTFCPTSARWFGRAPAPRRRRLGRSAARPGRAKAASPRIARCRCAALILLEQADRDELVPMYAGAGAGAALSLPLSAAVGRQRAAERTLDNLERAGAATCPASSSQPQEPGRAPACCSTALGGPS